VTYGYRELTDKLKAEGYLIHWTHDADEPHTDATRVTFRGTAPDPHQYTIHDAQTGEILARAVR
jgi:hypothetical protein